MTTPPAPNQQPAGSRKDDVFAYLANWRSHCPRLPLDAAPSVRRIAREKRCNNKTAEKWRKAWIAERRGSVSG